MTEHEFTDLLGGIDPALIARAEQSVPMRKKPSFRRALIAAMAAVLAMAMLSGVAAIAFIPKTYDLDYEISKHQFANTTVRVYYTDENGKVQSERVRMPDDYENVFITWKHLNAVDDQVQILNYDVEEEPMISIDPIPNTLWELLRQEFAPASTQKTVTVTLSSQITSYENYDALIDSLTETLAKYAGVDVGQVKILIDGKQIAIVGGLRFYHSLHNKPAVVGIGNKLEITVGMTNISDKDIVFTGSWSDFIAEAKLRANTIVYVEQLIFPLPYDVSTEIGEYRLAPGQSREFTYTFQIPEQAEYGAYNLIVSFGEQTFTFEEVVQVVEFSLPAIGTYSSVYQEFLAAYGLNTTDTAAFKAAVQALSHEGVGLFEIMHEADVKWSPGYSGEMYGSEHFTYTYSALSSDGVIKSYTNTLTATVLPDDMILPFGISPEEGLIEALCKLGMNEQSAQNALAQKTTHFFTNGAYSSVFVVTVTYNPTYIEISYEYGEHRVDICYDADGQTFEMLRIQTENTSPLIGDPVSFYFNPDSIVKVDSPYDDLEHYATLSDAHRNQIIAILNGGAWQPGQPDMNPCDYTFTVLNPNAPMHQTIRYSSEAGVFLIDDHYLRISNADMNTVNEIFGGYAVQMPCA